MANNLTAVIGADTAGFTQAINKAQSLLNQYATNARRASGEINRNSSVSSSQVEAYKRVVKQLDKVNSGTMTSTQQHKALTNQIKELKIQWANLNDEIKRGEFGKSVSASLRAAEKQLSQLDTQLHSVNNTLGQHAKAGNNVKGVLDTMKGKLGISASSFTKLGIAGAGASFALKLAKDSIASNESQVDALGIKLQQTESIYSSFVSHLNRLDFGGFLNNIGNVLNAAEETYKAMDKLNTNSGIISNREARNNAKRAELEAKINDKSISDSERKKAQQALIDLNKELKKDKQATANDNNDVVKSKINQLLSDNGFNKGTKEYNAAYQQIVKMLYDENSKGGYMKNGQKLGTSGWTVNGRKVQGDRKVNIDNIVTDKWREEVNPYVQAVWNARADSYRTDRAINKQTQKDISTGGSSNAEKTVYDEMALFFKKLRADAIYGNDPIGTPSASKIDYSSLERKPVDNRAELVQRNFKAFNNIQKQFEQGLLDEDMAKRLINTLNDQFSRNGVNIKLNLDTSSVDEAKQKVADAVDAIGSMGSSISQIGQNLEVPELNIAGMMAQSIASMIQGYATATAQAGGSLSPWGWLAFGLTGLAQLTAMISQMKSLNKYATGGIIGGATSVGDYNLARVNSGEMILNGTQQKKLFNLLNAGTINNGGSSNGTVDFRIKGKNLVGVQKNYYKKQSRL